MISLEHINMLNSYIDANVAPILTNEVPKDLYDKAIIIPATVCRGLLNGYYDNGKYKVPTWCDILISREDLNNCVLIIDELTNISKEEQMKFYDLLKYRRVGSFTLPDNCVLIVTSKNINSDVINSDIYALVAHV